FAGGAAFGAVPGALRARWGVNEIFVTVMLNFVAYYFTEWVATGPWNDPITGEAITRVLPESATLPMLLPAAGAHTGILIAIAVSAAAAVLLGRTLLGYEIRTAGDNPRAATLGGLRVDARSAGRAGAQYDRGLERQPGPESASPSRPVIPPSSPSSTAWRRRASRSTSHGSMPARARERAARPPAWKRGREPTSSGSSGQRGRWPKRSPPSSSWRIPRRATSPASRTSRRSSIASLRSPERP